MSADGGALTPDDQRFEGPSTVLAFHVPAVAASVPAGRRRVADFAVAHGASPRTRQNVELCLSEALSNAVRHGLAENASRLVEVVADVEAGSLEVVVADDGPGISARVPSDGLGLGLGLIAQCAQRFALRDRDPSGTEVWMRFELP